MPQTQGPEGGSKTKRCFVFDAYGTLFDVGGAARAAAQDRDAAAWAPKWPQLAEDWRAKQLEYTWLRAIAGQHIPFWQVTCDALDWALERAGLDRDPALRSKLLDLYHRLPAYPEVPALLQGLTENGHRCAILSNGNPEMLEAAITAAGLGAYLDSALSVEEVGVFKPARPVYDLVGARLGVQPGQVLFVSSNGWDVAGASGYGFETVWVNRMGLPQDRLWAQPHHKMRDLSGLAALF